MLKDMEDKAIQILQKARIGETYVAALPINTVNEVYSNVKKNEFLKDKIVSIDKHNETVLAENTRLKTVLSKIENKVSDIESSIGEGSNIVENINNTKEEASKIKDVVGGLHNDTMEIEKKFTELDDRFKTHVNQPFASNEGVHNLRYFNDSLLYKDETNNWHEIKTGEEELELIKEAMTGKISKNQFIVKRGNCTITGGCYREGKYYINIPLYEYDIINNTINNNISAPTIVTKHIHRTI